ncbi:MAG: tRNA lysidine(34) synthetase TilS [Pseudomonadota bacterium]
MTADTGDIVSTVRSQFGPAPPERIGVAVSGGGDSVALMQCLSQCFDGEDVTLFAATVDHGLRHESKDEAAFASEMATALGIEHTLLSWEGWDRTGNMQSAARNARYGLLTGWARKRNIPMLTLGHTADDQAETVLMRLGRSSGVTGLAAMSARSMRNGITLMRPLLGITRAELRKFLSDRQICWVDDPSNTDDRYDRIKARQALDVLQPLGISAEALSQVASQMQEAREALDWYTFLAARDFVSVDCGNILIEIRGFRTLPAEIARRLLQHAITWISGAKYPARRAAMLRAVDQVRRGETLTLGGVHGFRVDTHMWLCREFNAVRDHRAPANDLWDGRWRAEGPNPDAVELRVLGPEGLAMCETWRQAGRPRRAVIAVPGVWQGNTLLAAPAIGLAGEWTIDLAEGSEGFYASILSH